MNQKYNKLIKKHKRRKIKNPAKPKTNRKISNRNRRDWKLQNHGTIIRSKEKIILNEEKPTRYFFIHEKQKKQKNK